MGAHTGQTSGCWPVGPWSLLTVDMGQLGAFVLMVSWQKWTWVEGSLSSLHILESPATQVLISSTPQMRPIPVELLLPADGEERSSLAFDFSGVLQQLLL